MDPLDALWHIANFFGPAIGVGLVASVLCKLVWWQGLRTVSLGRLALWSVAAGAVAWIGGLLFFGRDGRMASYGVLLAAIALALWWSGLRRLP